MIRAIVIEDSRLARKELIGLLHQMPQVEVVGEADSVDDGLAIINSLSPELVFMDIHLSGGSAFDILSASQRIPAIIFTTAYDNYALKSFEYNTLDYLMKPISQEKLDRAVQKAEIFLKKNVIAGASNQLEAEDKLLIKDRHTSWLPSVNEIRFFESKGNYTQVYFGTHSPLLQKSLQQLMSMLADGQFIKINRSQLVNVIFIKEIKKNQAGKMFVRLSTGEELSVSRRQMFRIRMQYSL